MSAHPELVQQLKNDILSGQLRRGVALRQQDLSQRYGTSRIPIRDAIWTLKGEGWLVSHGKAGVMIPELDWREAEDLYQMRALLEPQLLTYAATYITPTIIGRARDLNSVLSGPSLSLLERGRLNWEVHAALYQVAERATLFNTVAMLNEKVRRYMGFQYGPLNYRDMSQHEHEKLFKLLEQNDTKGAVALLRRHIEVAGIQLVDYLKTTSEPSE